MRDLFASPAWHLPTNEDGGNNSRQADFLVSQISQADHGLF